MTKDLDVSIEGFDVIIVEDIVDSGVTLSYLIQLLEQRKPKSLRIATLLDKPERRSMRPVEGRLLHEIQDPRRIRRRLRFGLRGGLSELG